ncbi:MAG: HNH endonuclease [Alphaproteobacteria bacterium]
MERKTVFQRFVEKIKPPQDPVRDCWVWIGSRHRQGYGMFRINGKNGLAHRYSFDISPRGPAISGMDIDHLCRNPACVNPNHLEQVTHRENASRGLSGALRPGKASRFVGVRWRADRKRWCARAYSNGRHTHLGHFDSEEDASRAYQDFINNTGGNK